MNLTEYLFHRLRELGVSHTFGSPGDFVLPVFRLKSVLSPSPLVGEGWGGGRQAPQFLVG
jgi:TPP-dependent 2-oxoacid decarboxylase